MIDLGITFFFQLVNFVILYLILKHFLFEPVSNFMNQRSEKVANKIESAELKEEEAQELKEDYKQKINDAKEEARQIIEKGKHRGQKRKEEIISAAEEEADKKIKQAEDSIARAKQEARKELKDEVADISLLMTKKALTKVIDKEVQEQSIKNYIQELDQEKLGEVQ